MLIANTVQIASPRYDPRGWMQWPDHEEYSYRFMQVLGVAQEGSSAISECFLAASHITPGDDESWHRQWKKLADACRSRGALAFEQGNVQTARSNWLRASNYYRTAEIFLGVDDRRRGDTLRQMQECSHAYLGHLAPKGEVLQVPGPDGSLMQGYFLRAPGAAAQTPVVVCVGGPDHFKEEHLFKMPRQAHARRLSLLLVDLPGQGVRPQGNSTAASKSIEMSSSCWLDYLAGRHDVDVQRIAIFGDGLGASFATRAAASDERFNAAVCDGGIWDMCQRSFMLQRISGGNTRGSIDEPIEKFWPLAAARGIKCPVLVALGEYDWLEMSYAAEFYEYLRETGLDLDLKIFASSETAAAPAQIDNPTFGTEFIFDWIAARLRTNEGNAAGITTNES